jgi:phosphatidylglycerol lysyltransferase
MGIWRSQKNNLGIKLSALLTGIVGIVNLLSAVTPGVPERIELIREIFPFPVRASAHLFAVLSGFILLTLAASLLRRKRVAWLITIGLLSVSVISNLIKGFDYEESILAGVPLVQLLAMRDEFTAQSDRPSLARGLWVLTAALLFTLVYGTLGFYILDRAFKQQFDFWQAVDQTLAMFFTADNAGLQPATRFGQFFADSVEWVGVLTLLYALWMLLQPVIQRSGATDVEKHRARELVEQYGRSSLARFALMDDKFYFFSPSGRSVIAYVPKGRGAIALGDPIGAVEDRQEAIVSFQQFCTRNDWLPAFYQTLPNDIELYKNLGFQVLQIGEEAIVDLKSFTLEGKAGKRLRPSINKLTKSGYTIEFFQPPISKSLLQTLREVSNEWLQTMQGSEKKFSLGWFDEAYLRECEIAVVQFNDPKTSVSKITAFANVITEYQCNDVTFDLMRHRQEIENGTMDFLFVAMLEHFKGRGYDGFNLGLSALSGVGETEESQRLEQGVRYLYEHLNQFYNFQGLHEYKDKFRPRWEPRYFVYPGLTSLPDVVVALVRADSGDRLLDYFKPGS